MSLAIAYGLKKKAKKMAAGGIAGEDPEAALFDGAMDGDDMFADGGMVDDIIKERFPQAETPDDMPNDFDDFEVSAEGPGEDDMPEDDDSDDIVSQVMRARRPKDRVPSPA